jgi:hypothetical protein
MRAVLNDTTFLKTLFPWRSLIELRCIRKDQRLERKFFDTTEIEELIEYAQKKVQEGFDVYFGVASRRNEGGTKKDLDYINAVWVDIDCEKEGIGKEQKIHELLESLFPPTVIVDSGHGLHTYWVLREPTKDFETVERINLGLAEKFGGDRKAYDSARILRLPGTKNFKSTPTEVRILELSERFYNLSALEEEFAVDFQVYDFELERKLKEGRFKDEIIDKVISECAFLTHCKVDAVTLSEPEWYAMITNLVPLGAREKIHELSRPYFKPPNRYSFEETEKKIEHAKKDAPGPHTCRYIQNVIGFHCPETCPWRVKVKSPAGIVYKLTGDTLPFEILGFTKNHEILVWHEGQIVKFKHSELNPRVLQLYTTVDGDFKQLINAIISKARSRGLVETESATYRDVGIWRVEEGFLILNGKESYIFDGKLRRLKTPVWNGALIELGGTKWLDFERLEKALKESVLEETFTELRDYIAQWNFSNGEALPYVTAIVMLSPFQQAVVWRPWIYLTGRRGVGKTTFFDEVLGIFGDLAVRLDKTTAHAIVQEIGSTGKILILDEFELAEKRDQARMRDILELLKTASKGGEYKRGTTSDRARGWKLHHMVWLGSIVPQLWDSAQRSRTVFFELTPPRDTLKTYTTEEKIDVRHKIIAVMLKWWEKIEAKAKEYFEQRGNFEVQDGRIVDNFAYAGALLDIVTGEGGIPEFAQQTRWEEDEEELLADILNSRIEEETVYNMLMAEASTCERYGVKRVHHEGSSYLAVEPKMAKRYLLKDTKWREMEIEPLLKRLSGQQKKPVKMDGRSVRAFLIPWDAVERLFGDTLVE